MLASLLNDPETMQKLAGIASQLMGSTGASGDTPPVPEQPEQSEPPAQAELPAAGGDDPTADFMLRALPAISAIAQSSRRPVCPERTQLLDALRPFLSAQTCAQIDRAEHILSASRMTQAAAGQLLPQLYQREV